jgi:polar amino acid transport system substrate-binding protein
MRRSIVILTALGLLAAACGGAEETDTGAEVSEQAVTSESAVETSEGTEGAAEGSEMAMAGCDPLPVKEPGVLTVAAEYPYYEPFLIGEQSDPTGFEADLINGIAEHLGVDVAWENIAFDQLYAPGPKQWDVGVSEITITEERDAVVDFSEPYFEANQGILVQADGDFADATSTEDLADARFGAEAGTTGLDYVRENVNPEQPVSEFDTTEAAAQALKVGTIDVQVIDVPIAIGVRDGSDDVALEVIGQFVTDEQYGLTMDEGSDLKPCIDEAITAMDAAGDLQASQDEWFPGTTDLPVFEPAA